MRDDRSPGSLRALFLERYNDFRSQLRRRLGSDDLAHDAMQEAFLKVNDLPASSSIRTSAWLRLSMASESLRSPSLSSHCER